MNDLPADTSAEPPPAPSHAVPAPIAAVLARLQPGASIVALTGAGMSAASGIPTFRAAPHALWRDYKPAQLASPGGWRADPARVWAWYEWRRAQVLAAQPNAGHLALAALQARFAVTVLTQNVDDLHERAGSRDVTHLHGSLFSPRCFACQRPAAFVDALPAVDQPLAALEPPRCGHCGGRVRPGVVWFGEALPAAEWRRAELAVRGADLLLVVGTSATVQPAAQLPVLALKRRVPVVVINPDAALQGGLMGDLVWRVRAEVALPLMLEKYGKVC